jgi:hypothetical protein
MYGSSLISLYILIEDRILTEGDEEFLSNNWKVVVFEGFLYETTRVVVVVCSTKQKTSSFALLVMFFFFASL